MSEKNKDILLFGLLLSVCKHDVFVKKKKTCWRAVVLPESSGPPTAKTEWGQLRVKFTNAAEVNLKEHEAKSWKY